jgi:hypothetical protein
MNILNVIFSDNCCFGQVLDPRACFEAIICDCCENKAVWELLLRVQNVGSEVRKGDYLEDEGGGGRMAVTYYDYS